MTFNKPQGQPQGKPVQPQAKGSDPKKQQMGGSCSTTDKKQPMGGSCSTSGDKDKKGGSCS